MMMVVAGQWQYFIKHLHLRARSCAKYLGFRISFNNTALTAEYFYDTDIEEFRVGKELVKATQLTAKLLT